MKRSMSIFMLPAILALTLLAALILVTPVFAQDELPPEEVPEEVPAEDAGIEEVEEPAPIAEDLANTGVEVVDASGETVPLTEELSIVDPWFKVGTVTYTFTTADCNPDPLVTTPCSQPLQAAVDYISTYGKIPSDGYIHVDTGSIPNQKVMVNGDDPYINSLKGIMGHVNPDSFTPDAYLTFTDGTSGSYIDVYNKLNGFTISGLNISGNSVTTPSYGVVSLYASPFSTGTILLQDLVVNDADGTAEGICIRFHAGSVVIKNVDSSGNAGGGAYINNNLGTGSVTITNSSFNDNAGSPASYPATGLHIRSKGAVSLTGVSASRNAGTYTALWIEQAKSVTIKNSQVIDNLNATGLDAQIESGNIVLQNVYVDNNLNGINLSTKGSITFTNVLARYNRYYGARLDTCMGTPCTNLTGSGKVTIKGGEFGYSPNPGIDYQSGLWIFARGAISLTNVLASYNGSGAGLSYGAYLNNADSNLSSPVTITGSSFSHNKFQNLTIHSKGAITINRVHADYSSDGVGAVLNNSSGTAGITIKGAVSEKSTFNHNFSDGLNISTKGNISISYLEANYNDAYGFLYDNLMTSNNVTISNASFKYNNDGLYIRNMGTISATNIDASHNVNNGVYFRNNTALTPKNVTIKGGVIDYNSGGYGVEILTKGNVSLSSISANYNGGYGAQISQNAAAPAYPSATILNGTFKFNDDYGLVLIGRGTVKLTNIEASFNDGNGAYIENKYGNVSLLASKTGSNHFEYNTGSHLGIEINTPGAVTLNKVYASFNSGSYGVDLYYFDGSLLPVGNVTITGGEFNYQNFGLNVLSKGSIKINGALAEGNTNNGITLNNTADITGAKGVVVSRTTVKSNGVGLMVNSYGTITVNKIEALNNAGVGVYLDNNYGDFTTPKNISVLGSYGTSVISMNTGTGLLINTKGNVVISKMTANENVARAIDINNYQGGLGKGSISISYVTANNNGQRAIAVLTNNAVTLNAVTMLFNGFSGTYFGIGIDDTHGHNVKIANSLISGNAGIGIYAVIGSGVFTISNSYYFGNGVVSGLGNIQIYH